MLTIHLKQEDCDCLSAWVSARETGLAPDDALEQEYIDAMIVALFLLIKNGVFFNHFVTVFKKFQQNFTKLLFSLKIRSYFFGVLTHRS